MRGREKTEPLPTPERTDPIDRLFDAVKELNVAWAAMPRDVKLWINWKERRVLVQTFEMDVENHSRDSLRQEIERRGA